jgi:protein tyrosine phosphatase type 4A
MPHIQNMNLSGGVEKPIGSVTKKIQSSSSIKMTIGTKPTLMEVKPMRFLIMDAPRQGNLHLYIKEMRKHSVTDVVRVCEPTYQGAELQTAGIGLHDMEFPDGHSPPKELIDQWLQLVEKVFYSDDGAGNPNQNNCIAVHCVAGLGRAPVMVALALIEFANMDPVEAVSLIRRHRRGAINEKQLLYLEGYRKYYRKRGAEGGCCIIS